MNVETTKELDLTDGSNSIRLNLDSIDAPIAIGPTGVAEIRIGGTVEVNGHQELGDYRGNIRVVVVYN